MALLGQILGTSRNSSMMIAKVTQLHIADPYQFWFCVCGMSQSVKVYRKFGKLNCCTKIRHYLGQILGTSRNSSMMIVK